MELIWNEFGANKQEGYELLFEMAKALAEGEPHPLANLANLAALLGEAGAMSAARTEIGTSASEIVLPLYAAGKLVGVLDIDSPHKGRFTTADEEGLTRLAAWIGESSDWSLCGYTL